VRRQEFNLGSRQCLHGILSCYVPRELWSLRARLHSGASTLLVCALLKIIAFVTGCVQVTHSLAWNIPTAMRFHEAVFEVPPLRRAAGAPGLRWSAMLGLGLVKPSTSMEMANRSASLWPITTTLDAPLQEKLDKLPWEARVIAVYCESYEAHLFTHSLHVVEWKRNLVAHGNAREEKWRGNRRMEWVPSSLALYRTRSI